MGRQANRSLIDAFATKAAMIYFATVFPPLESTDLEESPPVASCLSLYFS